MNHVEWENLVSEDYVNAIRKFKIISSFLTFISSYENVFDVQIPLIISHKIKTVVNIKFYLMMFDLKELKLMFLDPTDLIINNINKYLSSNKTIKLLFLRK